MLVGLVLALYLSVSSNASLLHTVSAFILVLSCLFTDVSTGLLTVYYFYPAVSTLDVPCNFEPVIWLAEIVWCFDWDCITLIMLLWS